MTMPTITGKHLIIDAWGCNPAVLNDAAQLQEHLTQAAACGNLSVLGMTFHQFEPQGVTGVLLLSASHMSIHTWPELHYAALDLFTCDGDPWAALESLKERLQCEHLEVRELDRGILGTVPVRNSDPHRGGPDHRAPAHPLPGVTDRRCA